MTRKTTCLAAVNTDVCRFEEGRGGRCININIDVTFIVELHCF